MTSNAGNPGPPRAATTPNQHAPMTTLLTEQEAAALLRVSVKAVQGWRYRGAGPRFVKVGRCVRYRPEDLQAFVLAALRNSTSDPGPTLPDRPGIRVQPPRETTRQALGRQEAARPPAPYLARRRPPTWRRHGYPHIRFRSWPVLTNQHVDGSEPRRAR
jgi:hypothetical protein